MSERGATAVPRCSGRTLTLRVLSVRANTALRVLSGFGVDDDIGDVGYL